MPEPGIRSKICRAADGKIHLELSTDKAAFYVFAEFRGIQTVLSDNSFTLLPDRPLDLIIRTEADISTEELEKALVIRHLRSSYSE